MNRPIASSFDAESITTIIERALAAAGLQTATGPMRDVTDTIRRALSSAGMNRGAAESADASVIDVVAREVVAPAGEAPLPRPHHLRIGRPPQGEFVARRFSNRAGARTYKLYVPACTSEAPMPLIVMLHGCTQSPDDFAAGTQMNRLAEKHGFLVAYPEQSAKANRSKCWNWFQAQDQVRDTGEPSLIAGITRDVAKNHPVDRRRIFAAGLSAGAAMAVVLGQTYPELYAGIGVHSGLPYRAAHDLPSAFAAMKGRGAAMQDASDQPPYMEPRGKALQFVPTIMFHGDQDQTVRRGNGVEIARQASDAFARSSSEGTIAVSTESGVAPRGGRYSRTRYSDAAGVPRVESWELHGAGHAWSGGDASGSFTDGTGPDASAEMVRFFLAQARQGCA